MPVTALEAVVVDNDPPGPARPIAAVLRENSWPFRLRVLYEPTPGLSAGRNRGICAARGRYVAITDPDITPEPQWLQALVTAAREEKVFAVGGRTVVDYPGGEAVVLTKALRECHGAVDWPEGRELAVWPYWVTGCNLLFERQTARGRERRGRRAGPGVGLPGPLPRRGGGPGSGSHRCLPHRTGTAAATRPPSPFSR